jgi:pantoate--beta-alanine ligase
MNFTVTRTIKAQQKLSRDLIVRGKTIAIVPTMGFLHEGHVSLIRRGLTTADIVVTTIFVNPAQFAPTEDFDRYPRDLRGDLQKIKAAGGQVAFVPAAPDMYPRGFETVVDVQRLAATMEGQSRPGHFSGVATVVAKLFNIVRPDVALFGMKDYQQAMVLKRMTVDLDWPIKFVICPTVREKNGLALSSRNSYLTSELRRQAPALWQSLLAARTMARAGEKNPAEVEKEMRAVIGRVAPDGVIDYIAFTEMATLAPVDIIARNTVVSLAVRLGPVRLIDNMKIA